MKRIIFFDGDGTLWYPKKTKRLQKPHWVYQKHKNYKPHLILTPTTISTLRVLKRKGIYLVILSTHPHLPKEANLVLREKVEHFKLDSIFDEMIATRERPNSKKHSLLRVLKRLRIAKSDALMVGDSYKWDYQPARQAGIEAVLFDSEYRKIDPQARNIKKVINRTSDVLEYL